MIRFLPTTSPFLHRFSWLTPHFEGNHNIFLSDTILLKTQKFNIFMNMPTKRNLDVYLHEGIYIILYHDCSDLSHVLVFTITWQKRNQVISWYKTNIDCSIFGGWLNLLPLGALETATIFPWAFGPRENSSGLQSTSGK